jgi:O-antigen/teichoic acid export membrane protein
MTQSSELRAGQDEIRRGFVWLGAASAVARALDALSVLIVMWFVSREELGLATLAWSVAVLLESMNGLGLGAALLQTPTLDPQRLSAAFWYTLGLATALVLAVAGLSPLLASYFGEPSLTPLIIVSASKLWLVGASLVPLTLLNRATRFERLAVVSTLATLGSGILTCSLAALGFGAWALVIGQWSHGFFTLLGAFVAQPFWPRSKPDFRALRPDIAFGANIAASSVLYHFYRNADYYLLGRFLGVGAVGVYRVAFDLAMTPTLAVLNVVGRSALPVYARLSERHTELRDAFLWTLQSLGVLLAPVTALTFFAAGDLLRWVDHGRWVEAAPMVRWLSVAALFRCLAQTFPQIFQARRRPILAVYDSLLTMVLLLALLGGGLWLRGESDGPIVAAWAWTAVYPLSLLALFFMVRALIPLSGGELLASMRHTLGSLAAMGAAHALFSVTFAKVLPTWLAPFAAIAVVLLTYAGYVRGVMNVDVRRALSPKRAATP